MIPAEIAHKQHHAAQDALECAAPSEDALAKARIELAELIVAGKTVAGFDLATVIDCEMNENPRAAQEFAAAFGSLWEDGASSSGYWLRCSDYLEQLASKHLPESAVEDLARETAGGS